MGAATEQVPAGGLASFFAGLQAGMVAAFWMLIWLGVSAMWMRHSFWSPANIMASALRGEAAIRPGFSSGTPSGIALYLMLYSLLGAIFAFAVRQQLTGLGTLLVSILVSLAWYWLWFRFLALRTMPLVWLLHTEKSTQFGHVIFGALLARFGDYLPAVKTAAPIVVPAEGAD
jgi:hypothetical protein